MPQDLLASTPPRLFKLIKCIDESQENFLDWYAYYKQTPSHGPVNSHRITPQDKHTYTITHTSTRHKIIDTLS